LPIKTTPPMYETHDYSAVEEHITRQNERRELANKAKSSAVFSSYLKYSALGVVALGIAAFFVLWGMFLLKGEKIRVVEKEVVKNPPQASVGSSAESIQMKERIKDLESRLRTQARNTGDKVDEVDVVTEFVIFRYAGANVQNFSSVHTGLNYKDSKQGYPHSQFCYSLKPSGKDTIRIELAKKTGRGQIRYELFDSVSHHGLSRFQYKKLLRKCNFLN